MSATEDFLRKQYEQAKAQQERASGSYYYRIDKLKKLRQELESEERAVQSYKDAMDDAEAEMSRLEIVAREQRIIL
jgi:hypothetical protein